jgi:probable rRNA maturation factor
MLTEKKLQLSAEKILALLDVRGAALDIFLLKHGEIKSLKARFIKKKTEPNVLAFPEPDRFPHPETKKIYLGEIYLNEDILRKSPERTAPLLLHGIVHLLGYDHKRKKDLVKMEALERSILRMF